MPVVHGVGLDGNFVPEVEPTDPAEPGAPAAPGATTGKAACIADNLAALNAVVGALTAFRP